MAVVHPDLGPLVCLHFQRTSSSGRMHERKNKSTKSGREQSTNLATCYQVTRALKEKTRPDDLFRRSSRKRPRERAGPYGQWEQDNDGSHVALAAKVLEKQIKCCLLPHFWPP